VAEYGKQFRERAPAAPVREVADEQESTQNLASPIRQQLQAQFGRAEVDMAICGEDQSPLGTFILAEWAMSTAGLGSLTESSPEAGAQLHGLLHSEEWGETAAGIISRYATSNEPTHAHLALELIRRSRGQRLPTDVAARLSAALGVDVSDAVIHTDAAAAQAAKSVNAHAFATGHDVFFAAGKYKPGTKEGDELLAHELTHVVQDAEGRIPMATGDGLTVSTPNQSHEREAELAGREAAGMLHDGGGHELLDVASEMNVGAVAGEEAVQASDSGSVLHRSEDTDQSKTVPTEWKLLRGAVPEWLWQELRDVENAYHLRVLPAYNSWASFVADAADVAEDYFLPVEEYVHERMDGLRDQEEADLVADERSDETNSDGSEFEESPTEQASSAEGAMEEEDLECENLVFESQLAIERLDLFQAFFALGIFEELREVGVLMNGLVADGVLEAHQKRIDRAGQKTIEANTLLDNFVKDVFFEVVEKELKAKAKDVTITFLLSLVAPPAGAAYGACKLSRWALKEMVTSTIDVVTSDGQQPKFDQEFVNKQTNSWTGKAVDIKKLITDTEELTGPWERIDVLNKTLGRMIKILEVEKIAKEHLQEINAKLEEARAANAAVSAAWPEVLNKYQKFQGMAERLEASGPQYAEIGQQIRNEILQIETDLGWDA
jgi:hypothetical protein